MPKVTDEHRLARTNQILRAAWTCFAANGFHATSMADVISESGLSAGAVYSYFPSKESLIQAAAEGTVGRITDVARSALATLDPPDPAVAVPMVLEQILAALSADGIDRTAIALYVFGEAQRSEMLMDILSTAHGTVRAGFIDVARRAVDQGLLDSDADPEQVGAAMFGLLPGFLVQHRILGTTLEDYLAGTRSLLGRSAT
jgi:AcrR family transcriptional regulator